MIDLASIRKNEKNPRTIKDHRFEKLTNSIKEFPKMLALRPVIVDDTGMVLGGNMRLEALKKLGYKEVPDEWVKKASDLTPDEVRRFIIEDNLPFGDWDYDALANDWDVTELVDWGFDPEMLGIEAATILEDEPPALDEHSEPKSKLGTVYQLGKHRLMCGDSTKQEAVTMLLGSATPFLMVTDPPYGVEYDAEWRNDAVRSNGKKIGGRAVGKVANDDIADWSPAWNLSPSLVAYVWHGAKHTAVVSESLTGAGFEIRSQIIWNKNNFAISRGDYHWKHEACWYAVKKDSNAHFTGDRSQTTVWDIDKPMKSETGHSTQKPVECMARSIRNHDGDVYDPFGGSGTTLIACEQLGRTCYMLELDERYCDVIRKRYAKLLYPETWETEWETLTPAV